MRNSKILILLSLVIAIVVIAVACSPANNGKAPYKNQTVQAKILEINGTELLVSVTSMTAQLGNVAGNVQIKPNVDANYTLQYATGDFNFNYITGSFSTIHFGSGVQGMQTQVYSYVFNSVAPQEITITVKPEMLAGLDIGNTVNITFDSNGSVTKIEKVTQLEAGKEENEKEKIEK